MTTCSNCNATNSPITRFCAQCGHKSPVGETLRMLKTGAMGAEAERDSRHYTRVLWLLPLLLACTLRQTVAPSAPPPVAVVPAPTETQTAIITATPVPPPTSTPLPTSTPAATRRPDAADSLKLSPTLTPVSASTPLPPGACQKPIEDYMRVELNGEPVDRRTEWMLEQAIAIYGGPADLKRIAQGSYTDELSASFGTHAGGGAVDISIRNPANPAERLFGEVTAMVRALRLAGFAAWYRPPRPTVPRHGPPHPRHCHWRPGVIPGGSGATYGRSRLFSWIQRPAGGSVPPGRVRRPDYL